MPQYCNTLLLSTLVAVAASALPARAVSLADLLKGAVAKNQAAPGPANQFGATVRNPGSVLPEWWNEDHYVPETLEGAQRLRIGSAGANGRSTVLGRETCDLVLLYHAKAEKQLSQAELEECALTEYHLARGVTGEQVNLGDVFAKQDVIARFSKVVLERMARLKNAQVFYSRAFAFKLNPYDLSANSLEFSANLTSNSTRQFSYSLGGARFPQSDSWFAARLAGFARDDARALESARAGYRIHASQNLFIYKVVGTRELDRRRIVDVDLLKFEFQYTNEQNTLRTISF